MSNDPIESIPPKDDEERPAETGWPGLPFPSPAPLAPPAMEWSELHGDESGGQTPKWPSRTGDDD